MVMKPFHNYIFVKLRHLTASAHHRRATQFSYKSTEQLVYGFIAFRLQFFCFHDDTMQCASQYKRSIFVLGSASSNFEKIGTCNIIFVIIHELPETIHIENGTENCRVKQKIPGMMLFLSNC